MLLSLHFPKRLDLSERQTQKVPYGPSSCYECEENEREKEKKKKQQTLNVVSAALLGLLSPPCFLLPTVQTTSCYCQQRGDIAFAAQEGGQKCRIFLSGRPVSV